MGGDLPTNLEPATQCEDRKPASRAWVSWVLEPIRFGNSLQHIHDPGRNLRAACGLIGGVFALLIQRFFFLQNEQHRLVDMLEAIHLHDLARMVAYWITTPMGSLAIWSLGCLICYLVIPALLVRVLLRESVTNYGWRMPGLPDTLAFVLPGFALMIPLVYFVSSQSHFLRVYPFYEPGREGFPGLDFLAWELMYAAQFVALEFFFRGFMVHSMLGVMGSWAILVMVFPYCMIHFQKPFPEATASILAGLALGWLGIKTRSILPGALLHILVAWSMDATALWRKGYFD